MGTLIHSYTITWVHYYMGTPLHGYTITYVSYYMGTLLHGHTITYGGTLLQLRCRLLQFQFVINKILSVFVSLNKLQGLQVKLSILDNKFTPCKYFCKNYYSKEIKKQSQI